MWTQGFANPAECGYVIAQAIPRKETVMPEHKAQPQRLERLPVPEDRPGAPREKEKPVSTPRPWYRRPLTLLLVIAVALTGIVFGVRYYLHARAYESTDDAFIQAHVVPVSPKVASYVLHVHIDDNQHVQRGDLLVELDPRDFEARLAEARANLAAGQVEVTRAQLEAKRIRALIPEQAASRQDLDNANARERTAVAQVAQLEAAVRQEELDLSYTKIYAPETGRITRKHVEPGAYVQVGQTLFSLVPDEVWVVANFKETQLAHMRPGQPALIHVDAYPDRVFQGHVDSIQAGSGAAFSLLPPENATGNYVKVVQRVPVKIVLDEPPDRDHVLGPGMSVVPEVNVR
ncbi:MAG TPA: HlyD family secretion protein [Acidobacteriaceae bacterium]|nr:HlyD family secretion protein [Acidobacteriaceae bacterium]